jgi:hypothetical protein
MTCGLNYEAEYNRLQEEHKKLWAENQYLHEEVKQKEFELRWHNGFRSAVEIIFGKVHNYD